MPGNVTWTASWSGYLVADGTAGTGEANGQRFGVKLSPPPNPSAQSFPFRLILGSR